MSYQDGASDFEDEQLASGLDGASDFADQSQSEAGGLAPAQDAGTGDISNTRLANNLAMQKRVQEQHALANDAIAQGMGANAAQRWSGTPAVGLGMFKRADPIFAVSGLGRSAYVSRRIGGPTHMAAPPVGLIGGQALENSSRGIYGSGGRPTAFTPKQTWNVMFKPAATAAPAKTTTPIFTQSVQGGTRRFLGANQYGTGSSFTAGEQA